MHDTRISYNGWLILMTEDRDDDCTKIIHEAYPPGTWDPESPCQGKLSYTNSKSIDISPYSSSIEDCCAVIELGFPTRADAGGVGPLSHEEIEQLWNENPKVNGPLPEKFAYSILY